MDTKSDKPKRGGRKPKADTATTVEAVDEQQQEVQEVAQPDDKPFISKATKDMLFKEGQDGIRLADITFKEAVKIGTNHNAASVSRLVGKGTWMVQEQCVFFECGTHVPMSNVRHFRIYK